MSARGSLKVEAIAGRLFGVETTREGDRATAIELFFDLVYVFAFTQVTALMLEHPTAVGVLEGLVVLGVLWGPWVSFAWLANQAHADRGVVRAALIAATVIVFVESLLVPSAFRAPGGSLLGPLLVVGCQFLVQLVHAAAYLVAAGEDRELRRQVVVSISTGLGTSSTLLLLGALLGAPWQPWVWLVGMVAQWVIIWTTSRRGGGWRINSLAHFAERHGLVLLLALGESVVAVGAGLGHVAPAPAVLVAAVLGILLAFGLWWTYYDHLAAGVEHAIARTSGARRVEIANDVYTYLHLVLVAGIVLAALGVERIVEAVPEGHAPGWFTAIALGSGVSLYLLGTGLVWRRVSGVWALPRFAGAVLALLTIPVAAAAPPLAGLASVVVAIVLLIGAEAFLGRGGRWRATARARSTTA